MLPALGFAQNEKPSKAHRVVMVAGKPMTSMDSIMVKQLYFSALKEKTIENFPLAMELFNRVLQTDPANDAAMYELANLKKNQNDQDGAKDLLEKAVTVKPDNEWYWVALADSYEKSNDIDKLDNVFNELIRINPDKPDYYFDKANAFFLEKKYDEALNVYAELQKKIGLTDDIVLNREKIYLKQNKTGQAAEDLQKLIETNPNQVKYYLLLSDLYTSNGMDDKAVPVLEKASKLDPNNGLVHLALAEIYRQKNKKEESFSQLEAAFAIPTLDIDQKIKIVLGYYPKFNDENVRKSALQLSKIIVNTHKDNAKAYALYGDVLAQSNQFKEAKDAYKQSVALNGQVYAVREQLIRVELASNDIAGAIKDGEEALEFFPNQAWLNYFVGAACLQNKNYSKGLGYLKNAVSLETQDKDLLTLSYSAMGDCYHSMNDYPNSDKSYDNSLQYSPDNVYTLNNYAYYLSLRNEQLDKAAQMAERANNLQPNTASFEDTYAWILFKQKKYAEARTWIEKAITHDKDHSATQVEHYGDIMFYLGNTDAAVQNWKKAKDYGGDSPALERKINEKKYSE